MLGFNFNPQPKTKVNLPQTGSFSLGAMGTPQPTAKTLTTGQITPPMRQPSVAFSPETETKPSINPVAIARNIQQGISRSGAAIALTLANKPEIPEYPKGTIERKVKDFLFGEEAVKSLATRIAEGEQKAQQFGLGKASLPGAGILIGGLTGLDFTGMGGAKKVGEQLLKETGEEALSTILKKIGTIDELIPKFSKIFSKADTPEAVSEGLSLLAKESEALNTASKITSDLQPLAQETRNLVGGSIEEIVQNAKNNIQKAKELMAKAPAKVSPEDSYLRGIKSKTDYQKYIDETQSYINSKLGIPKPLEPLAQEARKYQNKSQFLEKIANVDGRGKSTNEVYALLKDAEKVWDAQGIGFGKEVIQEIPVKDIKLAERPLSVKPTTRRSINEPIEITYINGKPTLVDGRHRLDQAIANGEKTIKAKVSGQYIPKELEPLAVEARKYKSAEEFVKSQNEIVTENLDNIRGSGYEHTINEDETLTLYHKTTPLAASNVERTGKFNADSFFADSPESAQALASTNKKGGSKIIEIKADPKDVWFNQGSYEFEATQPLIRGTDGIYRAKGSLTKSQLTDFYNQVTKGVSEEAGKLTAKLPKKELAKQLPEEQLRPEDIFPQLGAKETLPPSIPPTPPKSIGEDIKDGIDWLINTIKTSARPSRIELEKLKSIELAKRTGAVAGVFERGEGLSGYYKALGKLKGELAPKTFKVDKIAEEQISKLMRVAQLSPKLDIFERLNAQSSIIKILNGVIPTNSELRLLEDTFGPKLVDAILESRTLGEKLLGGFKEAINLPRTIMSSFDLSAPFRQGLMLLSHPKAFGSSFIQMFKMFGSEKAFKATMETIPKMPEYELMKTGKLAITDIGRFIGTREEAFASSWAEKIPVLKYGVRASNRAYTGFLNKLRADVFSDIIRGARIAGKDVNKTSSLVKDIARFVNAASGRGGLGGIERAAPFLNGLFFSPRLMASRIYFMNPVNYVAADSIIRKEMLKSVFTVVGSGLTVLGIASAAGLKVGDEPRSSDWGKMIIDKTRVDIWGGFQQYARMIAQLITGEYVSSTSGKKMTLGEGYKPLTRFDILLRQIESKEAPIASFISALLKQQDYAGKPVKITDEVLQRFTPMLLGDMYDLAKENPNILPVELLGIFGFGIQTYQPTKKMKSKFSF